MYSLKECLAKAAKYDAWASESADPACASAFRQVADLWRDEAAKLVEASAPAPRDGGG